MKKIVKLSLLLIIATVPILTSPATAIDDGVICNHCLEKDTWSQCVTCARTYYYPRISGGVPNDNCENLCDIQFNWTRPAY